MNAHELYGLLNSVPIVHSGTIFHQQIPNYFVLHKAELRRPNKPNYVSITCTSSRDYFSLILDLTQKFKYPEFRVAPRFSIFCHPTYWIPFLKEANLFCYLLFIILFILFEGVSSSSGCLGKVSLFHSI